MNDDNDFSEADGVLYKKIIYFGASRLLSCDGNCTKAWGINNRPREQLDPDNEDDYAWLTDGELDEAPDDPGP